MKRRMLGTLAVALLLVTVVLLSRGFDLRVGAQSSGYDVGWNVLASAGNQLLVGGDYQLGFSLGQPHEPGISSAGSYQMVQGYWAGSGFQPTAVRLTDFHVVARGSMLLVRWETASEVDNLGFNLYRSENGQPNTYIQLNEQLIPSPAPGGQGGASYEWVDQDLTLGQTYYYLLEDVNTSGQTTTHGPVPGTLFQTYLPQIEK